MTALYPGKSIFSPKDDLVKDCDDTELLKESETDETNDRKIKEGLLEYDVED